MTEEALVEATCSQKASESIQWISSSVSILSITGFSSAAAESINAVQYFRMFSIFLKTGFTCILIMKTHLTQYLPVFKTLRNLYILHTPYSYNWNLKENVSKRHKHHKYANKNVMTQWEDSVSCFDAVRRAQTGSPLRRSTFQPPDRHPVPVTVSRGGDLEGRQNLWLIQRKEH